ncbi:MAG: biosynthetic-type acetolactate synthase large subunit [Oscillospiraceae bacterium]|nr:biosynthetic-type acetolactate synthase large subunit [Oscillospiraceae bacterium]
MKLTGAQIVIESLIEQGVEHIFGYPGGSILNIYDALYSRSDKIRHVLSSHEQGAAHAADGYARSTGKVGVVFATSGPGATNLITGIATAYLDSVPMVAITCNVTKELLGRDSFQEVDISGVTVPITKHNFFAKDIETLADIIRQAFVIAGSGRPGPVLIDIPKDVTAESCEYVPAGRYKKRPNPIIKKDEIDKAVGLINDSRKPCIYYGGGVISSGASESLQAFAKKILAPLAPSAMGLSAAPYTNPQYLGMIGMHGTPAANEAANGCDLLITVGARFSDRVTGDKSKFAKHAKVLHIDIDESEISKNIKAFAHITGDADEVLRLLLERAEEKTDNSWLRYIQEYSKQAPLPDNLSEDDSVVMQDVIAGIHRRTAENTVIVTDVGQHQMITAQRYPFLHPRTWLSSLGLGTMGYGMGAAIGAKIGNPEKPVVLISGDGCFHMNMNEFAAAVTENIPIKVFVMSNGVLGMVRQWQTLFYGKRYSSTILSRKTDIVKFAEAMGGTGFRINKKSEISEVVKQALAADGPVIVDCVIDKDESVYPIIPPGKTPKDAIMGRSKD